MRTLGPRSVSSFLKIALDIVFVLLAISLIALGVDALLSAIAMVNPGPFANWKTEAGYPYLAVTPVRAARLLSFCIAVLGLLSIVGLLRKIFSTLVAGEPFRTENASRLRVIGLVLAAIEASRFGIHAILVWGLGSQSRIFRPDINFTALFAIGVLFVLAEVFEEGVRMKKDLELTI